MAERESLDDADPLLTRKAVVADLCSVGIPLSFSRLEKLCMVGEGPPVDCDWGKRPLTRRSNARNGPKSAWQARPPTRPSAGIAGDP